MLLQVTDVFEYSLGGIMDFAVLAQAVSRECVASGTRKKIVNLLRLQSGPTHSSLSGATVCRKCRSTICSGMILLACCKESCRNCPSRSPSIRNDLNRLPLLLRPNTTSLCVFFFYEQEYEATPVAHCWNPVYSQPPGLGGHTPLVLSKSSGCSIKQKPPTSATNLVA